MSSSSSLTWSRPLFIAGTTSSAFLAGVSCGLSLITIPALLTTAAPTAVSLKLWRAVFEYGKRLVPPAAVTVAIIHATSAYIHRSASPTRSNYFLGAAASTLSMIPYTFLVMRLTNNELIARSEGIAPTAGTADSMELIKHWGSLNTIRSLFPTVGAILAFMAL